MPLWVDHTSLRVAALFCSVLRTINRNRFVLAVIVVDFLVASGFHTGYATSCHSFTNALHTGQYLHWTSGSMRWRTFTPHLRQRCTMLRSEQELIVFPHGYFGHSWQSSPTSGGVDFTPARTNSLLRAFSLRVCDGGFFGVFQFSARLASFFRR